MEVASRRCFHQIQTAAFARIACDPRHAIWSPKEPLESCFHSVPILIILTIPIPQYVFLRRIVLHGVLTISRIPRKNETFGVCLSPSFGFVYFPDSAPSTPVVVSCPVVTQVHDAQHVVSGCGLVGKSILPQAMGNSQSGVIQADQPISVMEVQVLKPEA